MGKAGDVKVASTALGEGWSFVTNFDGWPRATVEDGTGPFVFCTTVWSPGDHCETDSYSTWEEAEAGHQAVVQHYRELLGLPAERAEV